MVPWSGNMEPITYAWEDLEKGTDVLQYVYYVPEDYMPEAAYDITVWPRGAPFPQSACGGW